MIMKKTNIVMKNKTLFAIIGMMAVIFMLSSCKAEDDGPSIDDYPLNYTIPNITPTANIPVGALYSRTYIDTARYRRLISVRDPKGNPWPQLCPNVRPVLGRYNPNDVNTSVTADLIQQHIRWAQDAGIDFFIFPAISYAANQSDMMNQSDLNWVNYAEGMHANSMGLINWGKMKFALPVNMSNFATGVSNSNVIEKVDVDSNGVSTRVENMYKYFINLAERFFVNDSLYYKVDGDKPLVVLWNAQTIYSENTEQLYKNIRDSVYKYTNVEMFLLARQNNWSPSARYVNFFVGGKVDAVYMNNMYNQTDMTRQYLYPQMINENWKINKEFLMNNYNIDFVPTIAPSFNGWLAGNGQNNYNWPIVDKSEQGYRTMCNVAKMNLGKHPMVILDSFNDWSWDTAVEPTDPYYGKGYGMKYLQITREEFKTN